jgi:hypothetical protein
MPAGAKFGGRKKGSKNVALRNAKQAIADFVDGNADRLIGWLDRMAEDDPEKAFKAYMSVVEYHIPKLQRSDVTATLQNPDGTGILQGVEIVGISVKAGSTGKGS